MQISRRRENLENISAGKERPDPPIAGGGPGLATSTTALSGADDRFPHTTNLRGARCRASLS
jgi:hypothetical protein